MDSILSIFKIGVGPSSSHTIGPITAGNRFCELIAPEIDKISGVKITLHGSLSLTGKGHLTDIASIIGLSKLAAKDVTYDLKHEILHDAFTNKRLKVCGQKYVDFDYDRDVIFDDTVLPCHENGMILQVLDENQNIIKSQTYYSTGGGFVSTEEELTGSGGGSGDDKALEFDFDSAEKLAELCKVHNKRICDIVMLRESELFSKDYVKKYCLDIFDAMIECYENGINSKEEILPGVIKMKRLAPSIKKRLDATKKEELDPLAMIDYIAMYARAVSEENASGGKVVTAPTNGACGVIPAVLLYIKEHRFYMEDTQIINFILTCSAIGYLYKKNASISGAEAGCQAEIGVASSMAAAGMAEVAGATTAQVLSAAEIAMEHHLGLTCDPIGGLVQIPCIERNVLGAIKAVSAVKLALETGYSARVGLDEVITTMYKTGKDMNSAYKETSLGGLAKMVSC